MRLVIEVSHDQHSHIRPLLIEIPDHSVDLRSDALSISRRRAHTSPPARQMDDEDIEECSAVSLLERYPERVASAA